MAPPQAYDSDCSSDGGEDYQETNVLLGYAVDETAEDDISQLGGRPVCNNTRIERLQKGIGEHL